MLETEGGGAGVGVTPVTTSTSINNNQNDVTTAAMNVLNSCVNKYLMNLQMQKDINNCDDYSLKQQQQQARWLALTNAVRESALTQFLEKFKVPAIIEDGNVFRINTELEMIEEESASMHDDATAEKDDVMIHILCCNLLLCRYGDCGGDDC